MKKEDKKAIKKLVKKVVRNETKAMFDIIADDIDGLSIGLGSLNKTVAGVVKAQEPTQLPMAVAEFDPVVDREVAKTIIRIIKKAVKKSVKKEMKKYAKATDKEICRWLNHWAGIAGQKHIKYIKRVLKEAGVEVPEQLPMEKVEDQKECCGGCKAGIIMKPVSEATEPEKTFLRGILGMLGYSEEDLDAIFAGTYGKEDDGEDEEDQKVDDNAGDDDALADGEDENSEPPVDEEPHEHANKKWTDEAISELISIYDEEGAAAAAEHFGITVGTANRYYKKWKAEYDD